MPGAERGEAHAFKGASPSFRVRRTTLRSSSARSRAATGCSSRWCPVGLTAIRRERPRRCSTTRLRGRASFSPRVAYHPRRPRRVFVEAQSDRECLRSARASRSVRRSRRSGGGVSAGVCERNAVDRGARERFRGGREPGPAGVESTRGRSHPRKQHHASRGFRTVHGGGTRERSLVHEAPAIVGCQTPSALAHVASE